MGTERHSSARVAEKPFKADEVTGTAQSLKAGVSHVSACRGLHKTRHVPAAADEAGSRPKPLALAVGSVDVAAPHGQQSYLACAKLEFRAKTSFSSLALRSNRGSSCRSRVVQEVGGSHAEAALARVKNAAPRSPSEKSVQHAGSV